MRYTIRDLSLPMPAASISFPGDIPFKVEGPKSFVPGSDREYCYSLSLSTQTGTHVQGSHYFIANGKRIDEYPLCRFEGPALVLDCIGMREINAGFLMNCLPGDMTGIFLLLHTGYINHLIDIWSRRLLQPQDLDNKPGLTLNAARLITERKISLLGIDSTGFELYPTEGHPVNRWLCEHDVLLLENLYGLEHLPREGAWIECLPLPVAGVEGTPCRAIAKIPAITPTK